MARGALLDGRTALTKMGRSSVRDLTLCILGFLLNLDDSDSLPLQSYVLVRGSYNGLPTVTCEPPPAAPADPWWQRMPWIFIFVALAAAALLVALAW